MGHSFRWDRRRDIRASEASLCNCALTDKSRIVKAGGFPVVIAHRLHKPGVLGSTPDKCQLSSFTLLQFITSSRVPRLCV